MGALGDTSHGICLDIIYIIVVLWKTLSLHMFEHSIYNRIVMENSICCFIFHNVELHFSGMDS